MAVADAEHSFTLTGNGDVLEPEDGIIAIGSGGNYALSAARALLTVDGLGAEEIVRRSMKIAGDICVYTNHSVRVETLKAEGGAGYDVVCSRAFASLADFTAWSLAALNPGAVWMAMKGRHPADEIATLPPEVKVLHVEQLTVPGLDAERCIVWMRPATAAAMLTMSAPITASSETKFSGA